MGSVEARVVGLDLAGSPGRDTGACAFSGPRRLRAEVLRSNREILEFVAAVRPRLVVIDAPLSLPHGRTTIEDRSGPHLRSCDRELMRRKIPFFPLTLGPMRMLTVRGMGLARSLKRRGFAAVEGYPGGAQDVLGIARKKSGVERLQRALRKEGLGGDLERRPLTHDELDAVTIAWVGWRFLKGEGELIGDPSEGLMLLPDRPRTSKAMQSGRGLRTAESTPRGAPRGGRSGRA
jgi:uncharacterized protein